MADRIRLLPEPVANQIAAGEVVNRPSSVVKEMMENAVDAGGRNITVSFRDGGKALIRIIDDGCGMSPIDARLAFDRHATSKISRVEDIYTLSTFGFRGEALASIASVAEVELRTRQHDDELGTQVEIGGGKFISQTSVQSPAGSQFTIKNIFYNVPARRRFLDKSTTEARHIVAEYQRVALCNPGVAFALYDSDTLLSRLPPANLRQRVVGVIGKNIAKNLLDVSAETSIVKIEGFAGRPASARKSNREQFLFVNGRYFKSPYFHKAVVAAYEKLIPAGTQPSYFLYLTVDQEKIDVNVHPQKTEVKFSDGNDIWQIINAAVRESLARSGAVPAMDFDIDTSVEIPVFRETARYRAPEIKANPDFNPFEDGGRPQGRISGADISDFWREYDTVEHDAAETPSRGDYDSSVLEFINGEEAVQGRLDIDTDTAFGGVLPLNGRYFATTAAGALVVVDARRAWEAILFDRYLSATEGGRAAGQRLLFPERITMSIDDISLLQTYMEDLGAFGFEISFVDEHTIEITALPADFAPGASEQMLYQLLDALRDAGESRALRRRPLAAALARQGAHMYGASAGTEELAALLEQLAQCGDPSFTPSGAPVMTSFGMEELRKRLK